MAIKIALLFICLAISGCSMFERSDRLVYEIAKANFIYEADIDNELRVYDRIDKPFRGDCEDFAFTLQKQIGGNVWLAYVDWNGKRTPHAVLVKGGVVYDSILPEPVYKNYSGRLISVILR